MTEGIKGRNGEEGENGVSVMEGAENASAAVGQTVKPSTIFIAIAMAVFSGIMILILKRFLKEEIK